MIKKYTGITAFLFDECLYMSRSSSLLDLFVKIIKRD